MPITPNSLFKFQEDIAKYRYGVCRESYGPQAADTISNNIFSHRVEIDDFMVIKLWLIIEFELNSYYVQFELNYYS